MAGRGRTDSSPQHDGDSVASATRALVDATSTLSRLLGKQVSIVSEEVGEAIASGLRDAARGLADASESVDNAAGARSPRGSQRRRDRVDRTRADLLAAAGRVFAAQGYEGASVGDVAADAGYTKGAVYAHFGSKSELFLALAREQVLCADPVAHAAAGASDRADADADGGSAAEAAADADSAPGLASAVAQQLGQSVADPSLLLALEVLAYAVRHPEARPELGQLFTEAIGVLAGQVRDDRVARAGSGAPGPSGGPSGRSAATPPEPDQGDVDAAVGLLAVSNVTAMLAAISIAPPLSIDAGSRIVARLLDR